MRLLPIILFSIITTWSLSEATLAETIARIGNARARAITQRIRARTNLARNQLNNSGRPRRDTDDSLSEQERCLDLDSKKGDDDDSNEYYYDDPSRKAHLGHSSGHFHQHIHGSTHGRFPIIPQSPVHFQQHSIHGGIPHQTFLPSTFGTHVPQQSFQQTIVNNQQIPGFQSFIREAENDDNLPMVEPAVLQDEDDFQFEEPELRQNEEFREEEFNPVASQTFDPFDQQEDLVDFLERHHKLPKFPKFPKHHKHFRDAENTDFDNVVQSPYLFDIPRYVNNDNNLYKRSIPKKRSLPLARLMIDPKARLDVPKTMENVGTITKTALEDEKAPMYHMKNLLGSSRNAILSAMRIPPQHMIIPSDYEIVKKSDRSKMRDTDLQNDNGEYGQTFQRVGDMVRNSILSSQDTASHLEDIAHNAKNIIHSSKYALPKLIVPYSRAAALKSPKPAILLSPRVLDVSQDKSSYDPNNNQDFVRLGHILDAVGISKPKPTKIDLEKTVFLPKSSYKVKQDERLQKIFNRFKNNVDNNIDTVGDAVHTLKEAKLSVGAKNLRDFLLKMKNELTGVAKHEKPILKSYSKRMKEEMKQLEDKEVTKFVENLFNKKKKVQPEDTLQLFLPEELRHPFMGRPTKTQLNEFLQNHGDPVKDIVMTSRSSMGDVVEIHNETMAEFIDFLRNRHNAQKHLEELQRNSEKPPELSYILGSINPVMFERLYNETLKANNTNEADVQSVREASVSNSTNVEEGTGNVGTSMSMTGAMKKPFMGQAQQETVDEFLSNFNDEAQQAFEDNDDK